MTKIRHNLTIASNPEMVYKAITTKEGIRSWWTIDTRIQPGVETTAEFIFGEQYHNKMKIVDLQPFKRIEWHCLEADPEWVDTSIIFELEDKNNCTLLRFSHNNWRKETDFYTHCNFQWRKYMISLKKYCETGVGNPFTPNS